MPPPKYVQRKRLTCFTWNCGGLPPEHWDFLMMWLDSQTIDILLLQETHWPFTRDWISDHYLVVHSGENKKQAGLLCLISKKVCRPSHLSWYEHVPGRILQLCIHGTQRCIDILNVYQHTCIPSHMEARQQIWHHLYSILSTFSHRNILLMAGDFNCSADQRTDAIGYPMFQTDKGHSHGPRHADAHHLNIFYRNLTCLPSIPGIFKTGLHMNLDHSHQELTSFVPDDHMQTKWQRRSHN